MSKLPETKETIHTLKAKQEATDTVSALIERNLKLEEIFQDLQPLLYTLSVALYGDDAADVSLAKLIDDAVKFINNSEGHTIQ